MINNTDTDRQHVMIPLYHISDDSFDLKFSQKLLLDFTYLNKEIRFIFIIE